MRNVVLIGMPGAGKSTVGVLLAKSLKLPFLDTDLVIQTTTGRYLQEMIDEDGMEAFLDIESQVISQLDVHGCVIATGGSVVYRESAMQHLRSDGVLVFLSAPLDAISRRLSDIATRGIAQRPGQSLPDLFHERQSLYMQYADLVIATEDSSPEAVVTRVTALLRERGEWNCRLGIDASYSSAQPK